MYPKDTPLMLVSTSRERDVRPVVCEVPADQDPKPAQWRGSFRIHSDDRVKYARPTSDANYHLVSHVSIPAGCMILVEADQIRPDPHAPAPAPAIQEDL